MDIGIVSIRYAKALLQFAMEIMRKTVCIVKCLQWPTFHEIARAPESDAESSSNIAADRNASRQRLRFWRQPDSINAKVHQTCCEQEASRFYDVYCACVRNTLS